MVSEAIACGTPILASEVPGNRGLLGDYEGYFPVEDTGALRKKLERFGEDPAYRDQLRGTIESRRELVDPNRERRAWRELLDDLGQS